MQTSLVERMQTIRDRLVGIPTRMGVPHYRDVLIRHGTINESLVPEYDFTLITPTPKITDPPRSRNGLLLGGQSVEGIFISQDDFQVSGVSRANYTEAFFTHQVIDYWVDPVLDGDRLPILLDGNPQGIRCRLLDIDDKNPLTWGLTLRKFETR